VSTFKTEQTICQHKLVACKQRDDNGWQC